MTSPSREEIGRHRRAVLRRGRLSSPSPPPHSSLHISPPIPTPHTCSAPPVSIPATPNIAYRLGRYELLAATISPGRNPLAREAATALNPHSAKYWLDLAIARQSVGDTDSERPALERALAADPRTPDVAWQAANLYLAQGSSDDAMREFRVVMENDTYRTAEAISLCWKMHPDIDSLLANVVPPNAYDSFPRNFLISKNESAAAAKVWDKMFLRAAASRPPRPSSATCVI